MNQEFSEFDQRMMRRCLELAQMALGKTAPNPLVGAVVVKTGQVMGEGYHPRAGEPHAEVFALRDAGGDAQGATVYVNLEPCNHYGRTPPCSEALIAAGVSKVVVGMVDPNPQVAGRGIARLRDAGIEVVVGVEEAACQRLNEAFVHRVLHQRPFGILKYAMTLDGKIATDTGHSAWVTGSAARAEVHTLRSVCDAVIVGGNTVRRDNPLLTTHGVGDRQPLRVVMSRTLDIPLDAQLWNTDIAPTLIFTAQNQQSDRQHHHRIHYLRERGVGVIELDELTPDRVMVHLYEKDCLSVLWECGGTLAARAIAQKAIQKVWAFIAPKIIGGASAPSPVGDLGCIKMTDAIPLIEVSWRTVGDDLLLTGYLANQMGVWDS